RLRVASAYGPVAVTGLTKPRSSRRVVGPRPPPELDDVYVRTTGARVHWDAGNGPATRTFAPGCVTTGPPVRRPVRHVSSSLVSSPTPPLTHPRRPRRYLAPTSPCRAGKPPWI